MAAPEAPELEGSQLGKIFSATLEAPVFVPRELVVERSGNEEIVASWRSHHGVPAELDGLVDAGLSAASAAFSPKERPQVQQGRLTGIPLLLTTGEPNPLVLDAAALPIWFSRRPYADIQINTGLGLLSTAFTGAQFMAENMPPDSDGEHNIYTSSPPSSSTWKNLGATLAVGEPEPPREASTISLLTAPPRPMDSPLIHRLIMGADIDDRGRRMFAEVAFPNAEDGRLRAKVSAYDTLYGVPYRSGEVRPLTRLRNLTTAMRNLMQAPRG